MEEKMEKVVIEDLLKFKFLSSLKFSPNGRHAVFAVAECNKEDNKYRNDLYLLDAKTWSSKKLTSTGKAGKPVWLDDRNIAFAEIREEKDKKAAEDGTPLTVLQCIAIDGGEAQQLVRIDKAVDDFSFIDPDHAVVEYGFDPRTPQDEKDKAKAKEEKDYEVIDEIPYWFNGKGFTNGQRSCLGILDIKTGKITEISKQPDDVGSFKLEDGEILFTTGGFTNGKLNMTSMLKRYDLASGKTETLVADGHYNIWLAKRIEGKVVFIAEEPFGKYGLNQNPFFFRLDGNAVTRILDDDTSPGSGVIGDCSLRGGENIVVSDGCFYYNVLKGSTTTVRKLDSKMNATDLLSGSRSVDFLDVHGNDLLFCGMEGKKLQELYHLDLTTGKVIQITHFNEEFTANHQIADIERLNITNDGIQIDGFVMKPIGFEKGHKYPCILDIHGGPKCTYGDIFFHEMQVWAGRGYFVIFCNPRGGDGRGNEFADLRGKYGTIDYDDLMAFTDAAISSYPEIDSSRMGVTGGSYGGFMTNWVIGHTNRFKAAASQRSISNWISMANTTDIGFYFSEDQNGGATAWKDTDKLWWHSPLKYADKVKTPTLFINSDQDYRCWMVEGLQMFTALKIHGIEARMCLFHGENHELSRSGKPLHRIRRLNEITSWFDSHLK
jgi:dipeptidyl aminopeptidase/acylaminoacyl peptidase